MKITVKVLLSLCVALAELFLVDRALWMMNEPSDLAVAGGIVAICAVVASTTAVWQIIWRKPNVQRKEGN